MRQRRAVRPFHTGFRFPSWAGWLLTACCAFSLVPTASAFPSCDFNTWADFADSTGPTRAPLIQNSTDAMMVQPWRFCQQHRARPERLLERPDRNASAERNVCRLHMSSLLGWCILAWFGLWSLMEICDCFWNFFGGFHRSKSFHFSHGPKDSTTPPKKWRKIRPRSWQTLCKTNGPCRQACQWYQTAGWPLTRKVGQRRITGLRGAQGLGKCFRTSPLRSCSEFWKKEISNLKLYLVRRFGSPFCSFPQKSKGSTFSGKVKGKCEDIDANSHCHAVCSDDLKGFSFENTRDLARFRRLSRELSGGSNSHCHAVCSDDSKGFSFENTCDLARFRILRRESSGGANNHRHAACSDDLKSVSFENTRDLARFRFLSRELSGGANSHGHAVSRQFERFFI